MNKRKIIFGTAFLTAALAVGVAAATATGSLLKFARSEDNALWRHYSAVPATLDSKGIKEYWVSCLTNEHQFTAPSSSNIQDMGAPSQQFIDSLANNDDRLVAKTWQVISFENDSDINLVSSIRNGFNSKEVIDTVGATDGTHALKLTWKDGTGDFMIAKSYLDKAFADPNVTAVKFDAKATDASVNFQYITNTTGAAGDVTTRYEPRSDLGYGVTTEWKTFSWTRALYNNLVSYPTQYSNIKHAFLWIGLSSSPYYETFELYLDNFRPAYDSDTVGGFEGGRLVSGSPSFRDFNGKEFLVVENQSGDPTQGSPASWGFDYTYKSEGNRSMKFHKPYNKYIFFKSVTMRDTLTGDDDYFTVDIRASSAFQSNNNNKGVKDGNDGQFFNTTSAETMEGNRWLRLVIKKANMNNATFLKFTASTECDIYIDNIQYHAGDDTSFEGNSLYLENGYYYSRAASTKLGDNALINSAFYMQTNSSTSYVALSRTRASEGNQSLMFTRTTGSGDINIYFSKIAKTALTNGASLSIDIWTTATCTQMRNGRSTSSEAAYVRTLEATTPYAWKTYVLTADDLTTDGRGIIITGSSAIGDWYIDNIVIA